MALDPILNFAKGTVSTGYGTGDTSIILSSGDGANFPSIFSYNVVWWNATDYPDPADDPNVEIVRVTGRATDTLTITRAQESTSATTKNTVGKTYKMILTLTKKTYDEIGISTDVVDDTSPQLGGDLDLNSNNITGTGDIPAANLTGTIASGTWQGTAIDGTYIDLEGTEVKSTGEGGGTKYLREDGDGTCSWQAVAGGVTSVSGSTGAVADGDIDHDQLANFASNEHYTQANITATGTIASGTWQGTAVDGTYVDLEGTELKSTGEGGGSKYLREDGDGTCSWQTVTGGGGGLSLGTDSIIRTNLKTIDENITFAGNENGSTVGPISISSGYTVTVTSGSTWTII